MPNGVIVEMKNIVKSFYGIDVFKDFSLEFREGEIHCICGENGAGKSTLIKILSGAYQPNGGEIFYMGKKVKIENPKNALELGIQTIYQEHTLYHKLKVYENLFVGHEYMKSGFVDKAQMIRKTQEIMDYLETDISPNATVGKLGDGEQKLVEIARGLVQQSKMIIMDEPTSAFSRKEIGHLMNVLRQLKKDGKCIIYISHHLEEVFEIADRVTVIRDGERIHTYDIGSLAESMLINDMVGRDVSSFYNRESVATGDVMLEVKGMTGNGVEDISFQVKKGEILGFAGMVGAGKTEMAELLFGAVKLEKGEIRINGQRVDIKLPRNAVDNKMCFITESRQHSGLFLEHSIMANTALPNYRKRKGAWVRPSDDVKLAETYVEKLNIATTSIQKKVKLLSGGNQQKVVLAKWFATDGEIYIFDEPTKGIDIGAKEEIYKLMTQLIKEGKCIVLISSDMPELIAMSNRICVMRDGRIVAELDQEEISEQTILRYSIGGNL